MQQGNAYDNFQGELLVDWRQLHQLPRNDAPEAAQVSGLCAEGAQHVGGAIDREFQIGILRRGAQLVPN